MLYPGRLITKFIDSPAPTQFLAKTEVADGLRLETHDSIGDGNVKAEQLSAGDDSVHMDSLPEYGP